MKKNKTTQVQIQSPIQVQTQDKKWWQKAEVIISLIAVVISLIFSILSYCQSNKTESRQDKVEERNEKQYLDTKREMEIEKWKTTARDWFIDGEYGRSFKYYQKVIALDSADSEGYHKFLNKGNSLKTIKTNWKQDSTIMNFFRRAEQLKPVKQEQ